MEIIYSYTNTIPVTQVKSGEVFCYDGNFYMATDYYFGSEPLINRMYINLKDGSHQYLMNVPKVTVGSARLVVDMG